MLQILPPSPPPSESSSDGVSCLALDRLRRPCSSEPEADSQWCRHHGRLAAKWLRLYKTQSDELDEFVNKARYEGFLDPRHPPKASDAAFVDDEKVLRDWHATAKTAWTLTHRVIISRQHHHKQFHAGGDEAHTAYVRILECRRERLEELMGAVDQRLYHLMLDAEGASWLLPRNEGGDEDDGVGCHSSDSKDDKEVPLLTPPASPVNRFVELEDSEDGSALEEELSPEELLERRRKTVQAKLLRYIQVCHYCISDAKRLKDRVDIILNIIRRMVSRDAGLMSRARSHFPFDAEIFSRLARMPRKERVEFGGKCVADFINSKLLSLRELDRLWALLKYEDHKITRETIRRAIADVYRPEPSIEAGPSAARIWVLGGWVWRKPWTASLPPKGMEAFYEMQGCPGCLAATCSSFLEWANANYLAALGYYPNWADEDVCDHDKVISLFKGQFQLATPDVKPVKIDPVPTRSKGKGQRTVYVERQQRHHMIIRFPTTEKRTEQLIDELSCRSHLFSVIAKRLDNNTITHRPRPLTGRAFTGLNPLWKSRVRSGYTSTELRAARYTAETYFTEDSAFADVLDPNKFRGANFTDVWVVLVMDNTNAQHNCHFCGDVAGVLQLSVGCDTFADLQAAERKRAQQEGLLPPRKKDDYPIGNFRSLFNEPISDGDEQDFWS